MDPNTPHESSKKEDLKNKFSETMDSLKKNEKVESFYKFAQSNTLDTIAFGLMIVGLIWMFVNHFFGGLLVGALIGFYFSEELAAFFKGISRHIEFHGIAKSVILAGALLALLFFLPGLFIGAVVAAGIMFLIKK